MKHYCVHKFLALLLVAVGYATSSWGQNVAKVGSTEYATLAEAFAKATSGARITILDDIDNFGEISFSGKYLTLLLNNHAIKGTSITISGQNAVLSIGEDPTYPSVDADYQVGSSYIYSGNVQLTGSITVENGATFRLYSGTIYSYPSENNNPSVLVKGNTSDTGADLNSAANIYGGYIYARYGSCIALRGRGAKVNIGYSTVAKEAPVLQSLYAPVIEGAASSNDNADINLNKSCVLIAGTQSNGYVACGIYHPQNGTVNVGNEHARIVATDGAGIVMGGGTLKFTAGTIVAKGDKDRKGRINATTTPNISVSGIVYDSATSWANNVRINVSGSDTNISGAYAAIDNTGDGDVTNLITVTGGKFSSDVKKYLTKGYDCVKSGDSYIVGKYAAKVGDNRYATLNEAAAAAEAGQTITLLDDVDLTSSAEGGLVISKDKDVTLDLNGMSVKCANENKNTIEVLGKLTLKDSQKNSTGRIYSESPYVAKGNYDKCIINVQDGGEFVMESGYISTALDNAKDKGNFAVGAWGTGKVTIKGGTIEAGWFAITGNGDDKSANTTITVNGGTLISTADYAIYHPQVGKLEINGGTIYGEAGAIAMKRGDLEVNGGTITSKGKGSTGTWGDGTGNLKNAALNFTNLYGDVTATIKGGKITAEGDAVVVDTQTEEGKTLDLAIIGGTYSSDISNLLKENSEIKTNEDGTYTVSTYYAKIGDTKYATLKEAMAAVVDGQTVTLLGDVDLTDATEGGLVISKDKDVILDLNGMSIKGASHPDYNIQISGKLTLTDSKENSTGRIYTESKYVYGSYDKNIVTILDGGEFVMESGRIDAALDDAATNGHFAVGVWGTGKVTVNGGTIEAGWYAIAGNGADKSANTTITVNGGTLISTADYAIYHPQVGKLIINGGTIYGEAGAIAMKRGDLVVNDGTITSKGKGSTGTWGDGTGGLGNAALNFCKLNGNVTATIKGGTITAEGDAVVVDAQTEEGKTLDLAISGGTYSSDVSKYCVDGLVATPNGNGTYGISEVGDAMVVYKDSYTSIEADKDLDINMDDITKMLINKDVENVNVSLTRTYQNTDWQAVCLPFDVTLTTDMTTEYSFAKLYNLSLNDKEEPTVTFKSLKAGDVLPAFLPCLIKAPSAEELTLSLGTVTVKANTDIKPATCTSIEEIYTFYPVSENTYTAEKHGYGFNSAISSFTYRPSTTAYVQPLRYYLTIQRKSDGSYILPSNGGAQKVRYRVIGDGEATGITDINNEAKPAQGKVYNLQGVQVGTSTEGLPSGVYIQNGHKIIVK